MQSSLNFASWLKGIRVLDFTAVLAGPHCTRALAQAGADVIKIEQIGQGDATRALPYNFADGQSGYFKQQNLGKRSVAIDLGTADGHAIVMQLARQSQIVVENFRPGVVQRLGIDYTSIQAVRPDVVYLSISGWGQTGPHHHLTGEVLSTTALSGLTAPDPSNSVATPERCSYGDTNAAIHGVAAIGAALVRAKRTGRGAYVDLAILEALLTCNAPELPEMLLAGDGAATGREYHGHGGDHVRVASGTFSCTDGHIYIAALTDGAWRGLCGVIGLPEFAALTPLARRAHASAIYERLTAYCRARDARATIAALSAEGLSAVPVRSIAAVVKSEESWAAGLVQEVLDARAGSVPVPTGVFASRAFGRAPQSAEPLLGEHTRSVLRDLLGYADPEIDRMIERGIAR
ncbi:MAG: CaiB/BaiF CoA transferase family protein [Dehalococcoidia bacterium]